jgi:tetratricopeptide (TPR) repeat protein
MKCLFSSLICSEFQTTSPLHMPIYESEYRLNLRREKSREAISFAMESRWKEAVDINRSTIEFSFDYIEANNRLAKALFELGNYPRARLASHHSLKLFPRNVIAKKNRTRLDALDRQGHDFRRGA